MFCTGCGAYNEEGMAFCTHCGCALVDGAERPSEVIHLDKFQEKDAPANGDALKKSGHESPGERMDRPDELHDTQPMAIQVDPVVTGKSFGAADYSKAEVKAGFNPLYVMIGVLAIAVVAVLLFLSPVGVFKDGKESNPTDGIATGGSTSGNVVADSTSVSDTTFSNNEGADRAAKGKSGIIGNLINGGHMAKGDDGYVYFANPVDGTDWNTRSIVRCSADGSGKKTIYAGPSDAQNLYHLNVVDDRVVFNQVVEKNSKVISVLTDGSGKVEIDSCDDWSLTQVDDGWIYYLKSGRLYRCDLTGKSRATLDSIGSGSYWRVAGDNLYLFAQKGARDIMVSDLDGKNRKIVYSAPSGHEVHNAFPIDEETLLVWETPTSGSGTTITRVNARTGSGEAVWTSSSDIVRMCAYVDGVIITKNDSGETYSIATIPYDTGSIATDVAVTHGAQARYTCCVGDQIFYGVVDTNNYNCSVWSIGLTGYGALSLSN